MERTRDTRPPDPEQGPPVRTVGILAVAGFGLCVAVAAIGASSEFAADRGIAVVAHVLVVAAPVSAGLYAISRQRATRFGWLLVIAGFVSAPTVLAETGNSVLYSIGRVDAWIVEVMLVYLVL